MGQNRSAGPFQGRRCNLWQQPPPFPSMYIGFLSVPKRLGETVFMVGAGRGLASTHLLCHLCRGLLFVLVMLHLVLAVEDQSFDLPKGLGLALCFSSVLLLG